MSWAWALWLLLTRVASARVSGRLRSFWPPASCSRLQLWNALRVLSLTAFFTANLTLVDFFFFFVFPSWGESVLEGRTLPDTH